MYYLMLDFMSALYINYTFLFVQMFGKMVRVLLAVVRSDVAVRGKALKALNSIVDVDPSVLADVCVLHCLLH